jgi:sulfur relay (sulfurtransferase) DsrF/TusC family protein
MMDKEKGWMAGKRTDGKAPKRVLLALHSGTYGRTDDVVGALILADTLLTKGMDVTVLLRGDGVYAALAGQRPRTIGLESHIDHLEAAVEMGARVLAVCEDLDARGLKAKDLVPYVEEVAEKAIPALMADHDHWIPI